MKIMPNPAMNDKFTEKIDELRVNATEVMTVNGTATKGLFLLLLVILGGSFTWTQVTTNNALAAPLMFGGLLVGAILSFIIIFKQTTAPVLAPIYAVMEGLFLGGISAMYAAEYSGIVIQAIIGTLATLFLTLSLYISRIIRVDEKFRSIVLIATGSVAIIYFVSIIMSFFGMSMPYLHSSGPIGIGINLVIICIAASNFLLDFNLIEYCTDRLAPKYLEWYCSFGVLVTLVWVYLEILKLLARLNRR